LRVYVLQMHIADITRFLETVADPALQESYDNAGLITGDPSWPCSGVICSLDATEEVILEAVSKNCNMVVAHHPIVFSGLKRINGKNYVEKAIITAIKNDVAIYAIHTNLDNVKDGVNGKIAAALNLRHISILKPRPSSLRKLFTFVPSDKAEQVRTAIFQSGGGHIGNYSECSFNVEGTGTFKAEAGSNPYVGQVGQRHEENELKVEVVFPSHLESSVVQALRAAHPYEEVAFDIVSLANAHPGIGSGMVGELEKTMEEAEFLKLIGSVFKTKLIRHSPLLGKPIRRVALCGGAGSFLISSAISAGADIYITADIKYHEFFDANARIVVADIGHFESEQFTIDLLAEHLEKKFTTFAVLKTAVETNPVKYFIG
jgi:dinuclear metal center YbgI/SA1388 family protein